MKRVFEASFGKDPKPSYSEMSELAAILNINIKTGINVHLCLKYFRLTRQHFSGTTSKPRRRRTTIEQYAKVMLEVTFRKNQRPTSSELEMLSDALCMQLETVRTWFQNRRAKARKSKNIAPTSEDQ
ncbi:hypothetical protein WA026_023223 [Henosepilachna vigintioctopunctata]|uniref:Homeobox domain-containing protein n=1 Tax=Henosepilachna vigintioctopunctata TaxID=420089 RepID=A0AAW1VG24_9CUCU